jgi:hypothetical protein
MILRPLWPLLPEESYWIRYYGSDVAGNEIEYGAFNFFTIQSPGKRTGYVLMVVVDSDEDPIEDAVISVNGTEIGSTDHSGEFTMELPIGQYEVRIRKEGYLPVDRNITVEYGLTTDMGSIVMEKEEDRGELDDLPLFEVMAVLSLIMLVAVSVAVYVYMERRSIPSTEE